MITASCPSMRSQPSSERVLAAQCFFGALRRVYWINFLCPSHNFRGISQLSRAASQTTSLSAGSIPTGFSLQTLVFELLAGSSSEGAVHSYTATLEEEGEGRRMH